MYDFPSESKLFSLQKKHLLWVLIPVFFFLLVLSLFTPMVSDDFAYSFSWVDWTRIRHIRQIIPSMVLHREITNGRVFVHALVQLLLMLPRFVYALLNALNGIVLLVMIRSLVRLQSKTTECIVLASAFAYLLSFTPALGENYFWLDGAVNYAWGMSISLLFLMPFIKNFYFGRQKKGKWCLSIFELLLAFLFGTWSESASLIILFLAAVLWLISLKETRSFQAYSLLKLLIAALGYLFLMSAPATTGRASISDVSVLGYNFRIVFAAAQEHLLVPLLIYSILLAFSLSNHIDNKQILISGLFFFGSLLSLLSYVFAAYFVERHLCCTVFLLMLASVTLLAALCNAGKSIFAAVGAACLSVLLMLQIPVGILDVAISYHKQQIRELLIQEALENGTSCVTLENYYPYSKYAIPFILNETDPSRGPNINISDYYGVDAVLGVDPVQSS